ncbi:hypothetical protein [Escherichia coli]
MMVAKAEADERDPV